MDEVTIIALKIMFIMGFTLHNIEEAIWLPAWSKLAIRFQRPVERTQFIFADIVITMIGYIVTILDLVYGHSILINLAYLGFIGMMGINVLLPHLAGTIILKKYSPGLLTGLFLNLPLSIILISLEIREGTSLYSIIIAIILFSIFTLGILKFLLKLGARLFNYEE
jgi:hypothetical protein